MCACIMIVIVILIIIINTLDANGLASALGESTMARLSAGAAGEADTIFAEWRLHGPTGRTKKLL
jgi:hypothetical protein